MDSFSLKLPVEQIKWDLLIVLNYKLSKYLNWYVV